MPGEALVISALQHMDHAFHAICREDRWAEVKAAREDILAAKHRFRCHEARLNLARALGPLDSAEACRPTGGFNWSADSLPSTLNSPMLPSIDPSTLERIESPAGEVTIVDLLANAVAPDARRFRIGLLKELEGGSPTGQTWFFKLDGPSTGIQQQQDVFEQMLGTLRWADGGAANDG